LVHGFMFAVKSYLFAIVLMDQDTI